MLGMGLYLSDDLYGFPNIQLQLIMVHGVVGKCYLAFPDLWHFFNWTHKSQQEFGGKHA